MTDSQKRQPESSFKKSHILLKVQHLASQREGLVLHLQVKALYSEVDLEELIETIEERGAYCNHLGDGRWRVTISPRFSWIPFYQTIRDCTSVELTDVTTFSQKRTILIEPEG